METMVRLASVMLLLSLGGALASDSSAMAKLTNGVSCGCTGAIRARQRIRKIEQQRALAAAASAAKAIESVSGRVRASPQ
jgi:hypothetical protein